MRPDHCEGPLDLCLTRGRERRCAGWHDATLPSQAGSGARRFVGRVPRRLSGDDPPAARRRPVDRRRRRRVLRLPALGRPRPRPRLRKPVRRAAAARPPPAHLANVDRSVVQLLANRAGAALAAVLPARPRSRAGTHRRGCGHPSRRSRLLAPGVRHLREHHLRRRGAVARLRRGAARGATSVGDVGGGARRVRGQPDLLHDRRAVARACGIGVRRQPLHRGLDADPRASRACSRCHARCAGRARCRRPDAGSRAGARAAGRPAGGVVHDRPAARRRQCGGDNVPRRVDDGGLGGGGLLACSSSFRPLCTAPGGNHRSSTRAGRGCRNSPGGRRTSGACCSRPRRA